MVYHPGVVISSKDFRKMIFIKTDVFWGSINFQALRETSTYARLFSAKLQVVGAHTL